MENDTMPEEVYGYTDVGGGTRCAVKPGKWAERRGLTPYILKSHHTAEVERLQAEIQKRDDALHVCRETIEGTIEMLFEVGGCDKTVVELQKALTQANQKGDSDE